MVRFPPLAGRKASGLARLRMVWTNVPPAATAGGSAWGPTDRPGSGASWPGRAPAGSDPRVTSSPARTVATLTESAAAIVTNREDRGKISAFHAFSTLPVPPEEMSSVSNKLQTGQAKIPPDELIAITRGLGCFSPVSAAPGQGFEQRPGAPTQNIVSVPRNWRIPSQYPDPWPWHWEISSSPSEIAPLRCLARPRP